MLHEQTHTKYWEPTCKFTKIKMADITCEHDATTTHTTLTQNYIHLYLFTCIMQRLTHHAFATFIHTHTLHYYMHSAACETSNLKLWEKEEGEEIQKWMTK